MRLTREPRIGRRFTANISWERATGYLSDQYKLVQKDIEVAPGVFLPFTFGENRPDTARAGSPARRINRAFPEQHGALEASYRFYHDTFGTDAHTIELHWLQHVGKDLILEPELRFYDAERGGFLSLPARRHRHHARRPERPRPQGPFYSSDYRLSDLTHLPYGLKVVWTPAAALAARRRHRAVRHARPGRRDARRAPIRAPAS